MTSRKAGAHDSDARDSGVREGEGEGEGQPSVTSEPQAPQLHESPLSESVSSTSETAPRVRRGPVTMRRRAFVHLVEHLQQELLAAYEEERSRHGLTRGKMATLLEWDKGFLSRKMNITSNMTLETLADLAYALNRPVRISLPSRDAMLRPGDNRSAPPPPHLSLSAGAAPVATPSYEAPIESGSESSTQSQPQVVIIMRSL